MAGAPTRRLACRAPLHLPRPRCYGSSSALRAGASVSVEVHARHGIDTCTTIAKMAAAVLAAEMSAEMLEQFAERVGLRRADLTADLPSLRALAAAMTSTVAFENLDCALGRGVDTALPAVYAKIVTAGRGGYCFENNTLIHHVLVALGYDVSRRVARVVLGPSPSGFTHLVNMVRLPADVPGGSGGGEYLVDVGFGGNSLRAPLPLASLLDVQLAPGAVGRVGRPVLMYPDVHRLVDDCEVSCLPPGGYRLQSFQPNKWHEAGMPAAEGPGAAAAGCWVSQYAFHPGQPVCDRDIVTGSHYVSTLISPSNFFTGCR